MKPFEYGRATTVDGAIADARRGTDTAFVAGGTTLLDLMKLDVLAPGRLIDVNPLPLTAIEVGDDGLRIGALARMSDVAAHEGVAVRYPGLAQKSPLQFSEGR